jgi:hypothetical protein
MEVNRCKSSQMNYSIIKIEYDRAKLIFRLHQDEGVNVKILILQHLFAVSQFVYFDQKPCSKHVDDNVHVLPERPSDIPSRYEIDYCVNIHSPSWVSNGTDVTQQLCIISAIRVVEVMVRLLDVRLEVNVVGAVDKLEYE